MVPDVNSSHMVLGLSSTHPYTWSHASAYTTSSVSSSLYLKTCKATTPNCSRCVSFGSLGARHEHNNLGANLDCARRRWQSVCLPSPLWIWKGSHRKLKICQSEYQMQYTMSQRRIVNNKAHHVHANRLAGEKTFDANVQVRTCVMVWRVFKFPTTAYLYLKFTFSISNIMMWYTVSISYSLIKSMPHNCSLYEEQSHSTMLT